MQKKLKTYDQFSKKERIGILTIIGLILFLLCLPYLIPRKTMPDFSTITALGSKWKSMVDSTADSASTTPVTIHLYPFDPNTFSVDEWQGFGVPLTVANRIINYISKGGRFRKAEDLRKIWGMPKALADRLIPFVKTNEQKSVFQKITIKISPIDINTADLEAWKSLPGIGNVLAERIIKYRERSNGFGSKEELTSVFGVKDSLFKQIEPYLRVEEVNLQKIPLNRASAYQIAQKTGIPVEVAKSIVSRRQESGWFTAMEQILDIPNFKQEWLVKFIVLFYIE